MKILITGAMGYDGAGLIQSYWEDGEHEITLLDNRFVPHLVSNLPGHFRFIQGNVLDSELMLRLCDSMDIVYHLAGEVEAEKSVERERLIWEVNHKGAVTTIDACDPATRLVFASTGNVFGGVEEDQKNMDLNENDAPCPKLPYAQSKRAVEENLLASNKNYTIVRFGTHFGFTPGIRFNLVTNNFFLKAMTGQDIPIHGSGDNYRPTLCSRDAVRGVRFLAETPAASGEIFHLVGENYRIRDLAQTVAGQFPNAKVRFVDKVVPFNSYHLSSDKIRALGFEFEWTIPEAIQEMRRVFSALEA